MAKRTRKRRKKAPVVSQTPPLIELGSMSHVGMKRETNEDAFCGLVGRESPQGATALLAVADGMGGHQAGEVASAMAIAGLVRGMEHGDEAGEDGPDARQHGDRLANALRETNRAIYLAASKRENYGMGTTITAGLLVGHQLHIAHVGDSRAYLVRDGNAHQLTRDHSWVAEEVARGAMTAEQAKTHPRRNVLTAALGVAPEVDVDMATVDVREGDWLLFCSDGLHSLVTEAEIAETVDGPDPRAICERLVAQANDRGGHDNITVLLARIGPLGESLTRPSPNGADHEPLESRPGRQAKKRSALMRGLRVLFMPVWVPLWVLIKLVRILFM